jgi:clan AA aspartic protease
MGKVRTRLVLANPLKPGLSPIEAEAFVDIGVMHLCIPERIVAQLEFNEREKREMTLVNGAKRLIPYVGPVEVLFGDRSCFVGALAMGDEVLLGAIPMEDMDLVVLPLTREVTVNPLSPNIPTSIAKWFGKSSSRTVARNKTQ